MSATDELRRLLDERGVEYEAEDMQTNMQTYWGDWCFMEPLDAKPHTLGAQCELMCIPATPEQAIAATLGDDEKLLDLAHNAWGIAVCAMQGMPIPASWGNAVEKGLRERGIDVDELPYVVPDAALGGGECEQVLVDCDDGLMPPFTAYCSKCGKQWGYTPKFCPECGARVARTRDERKAVKR